MDLLQLLPQLIQLLPQDQKFQLPCHWIFQLCLQLPVSIIVDWFSLSIYACSSILVDTDFSLNITEFEFMLPFTVDDLALILVSALDDQILEGNEDIIFSFVMDSISTLPGLTVNIVNNNITIIDDEGTLNYYNHNNY